MWNPYYFNGGIAVHGLDSVPSPGRRTVRSHPDDTSPTTSDLVTKGESVRGRHAEAARQWLRRSVHPAADDHHPAAQDD
jgi:hypothetical protein